MKKHTTYYIMGAVLVGVGVYLFARKNNEKSKVNLNPPMVVTEEADGTITTMVSTEEPVYLTVLDKIKEIIAEAKKPSQNG